MDSHPRVVFVLCKVVGHSHVSCPWTSQMSCLQSKSRKSPVTKSVKGHTSTRLAGVGRSPIFVLILNSLSFVCFEVIRCLSIINHVEQNDEMRDEDNQTFYDK